RRALAWLYDDRELSSELHGIARVAGSTQQLEDLALAADTVAEARRAVATTDAIVIACGHQGLGRRSLLIAAMRERKRSLLDIEVSKLSTEREHLAKELDAIARECLLLELDPMLRGLDDAKPEHQQLIVDVLSVALPGPILATARRRPMSRCERPVFAIELEQPN